MPSQPRREQAVKCLNGHAANSDGNCSVPSCPYRIAEKHDGIGR